MNAYVAEHALPKFVQDDLEIILDELCAGYRDDIAERLRTEYTDHYTAAYEGAIAEGWVEEMAHKKALQDLGWETTLKVGQVCKYMTSRQRMFLHVIQFSKNPYPWRSIALYSFFAFYAFYILYGSISKDDPVPRMLGLTIFASGITGVVYTLYKAKVPTKKQPPKHDDIKWLLQKLVARTVTSWAAFCTSFAILSWLILDLGDLQFFLILGSVLLLVDLMMLRNIWSRFTELWGNCYPDDRIF